MKTPTDVTTPPFRQHHPQMWDQIDEQHAWRRRLVLDHNITGVLHMYAATLDLTFTALTPRHPSVCHVPVQ